MRRTAQYLHSAVLIAIMCLVCHAPASALAERSDTTFVFPGVTPLTMPEMLPTTATGFNVSADGTPPAAIAFSGQKPLTPDPDLLAISLVEHPAAAPRISVPILEMPADISDVLMTEAGSGESALKPVPQEEDTPVQETAQQQATPPAQQQEADLSILNTFSSFNLPPAEEPQAEAAPEASPEEHVQVAAVTPPSSPAPAPNIDKPSLREDPLALDLSNPPDDKSAKAISQFRTFASEWVAKINRTYTATRENLEIVEQNGTYIARYTFSPEDSLAIQVKRSEYDHTPFVGVMRYNEITFESQGTSPDEAKTGEFVAVKVMKVTEIFRYDKNKWMY